MVIVHFDHPNHDYKSKTQIQLMTDICATIIVAFLSNFQLIFLEYLA